jgi:hypothetical protein
MSSPYYDLAKEILTKAYPRSVKCLDSSSKSWDEDSKGIWGKMTKDERGWYVLFSLVEYGHDWTALAAISPSPAITQRYHKIYNDRRNAYNRNLDTLGIEGNWVKWIKEISKGRGDKQVYKQNYSSTDYPCDLNNPRVWKKENPSSAPRPSEEGPLDYESPSRPLWY